MIEKMINELKSLPIYNGKELMEKAQCSALWYEYDLRLDMLLRHELPAEDVIKNVGFMLELNREFMAIKA